MNRIRYIFLLGGTIILMWSCASEHFQIEIEPSGARVLKGTFQRSDLEQDSTFSWYQINYSAYAVDPEAIQEIAAHSHSDDIRFVMVLGTWCGDSKREVPQVFKVIDAAGINDHEMLLLGVDRSKKSDDGLTDRYNVQRVPTLIVLKGDQELGRIVEYPKETLERDIARILQKQ